MRGERTWLPCHRKSPELRDVEEGGGGGCGDAGGKSVERDLSHKGIIVRAGTVHGARKRLSWKT